MINADNHNIHILHRALTAEEESSPQQSQQQPDHQEEDPEEAYTPVSPLLPAGLEYERPPPEFSLLDEEPPPAAWYWEWLDQYSSRDINLMASFVLLVVAGAANIVAAKLQAISMYNYGVFLSLFSYMVYVPLCFAFIIPVSKFGWLQGAITEEHLALPKRPFAIMGALDCISSVMQVFASIYLPGSLLVLLPQAAIPLSMLLSKHMLGERYRRPQYIGAVVVFLGVLVVLEPIVTYRHAPAFYCEAIDLVNNCTACRDLRSEEDCRHFGVTPPSSSFLMLDGGSPYTRSSVYKPESPVLSAFWSTAAENKALPELVFLVSPVASHHAWDLPEINNDPHGNETVVIHTDDDDDRPDEDGICRWLPYDEVSDTTRTDFVIFAWSLVMLLSCIPMTLSSVYKQIKLSAHGDMHPIFLFGWTGVFQLMFSIIFAAPMAGLATGIPLQQLPQNLLDGLKCYFGEPSVDKGCHPDSTCRSGHAFLYVNLCLFCQAVYLLCMMLVLKYGSTSLLYLALTLMVPMGNLAFSLPFMPIPSTMHVSDIVALLVIVVGLMLYRFGHALSKSPSSRTIIDAHDEARYVILEVPEDEEPRDPCHPLLEPLMKYAYV